jgi:hypothetical protein
MTTTVLNDATTGFTEALTEAARNLNLAAADLQDDWADLSQELESQGWVKAEDDETWPDLSRRVFLVTELFPDNFYCPLFVTETSPYRIPSN